MRNIILLIFFILAGCASPTAFMGNGIFSLGASQSLSKAAVSTGSDYLIKKETGKNKVEHLSSKLLNKDCIQEKNIKLSCK